MARYDEERDRDRRDREREREERERRQYGNPEREYTGRDWSGGMGSYSGMRGSERYGNPGPGSEGWGRDERWGGGDRWGGEQYGQGERWAGQRDRGEYESRDRDRDREQWGRDWGGQGFSGREGGWGGYGSYDRERYGREHEGRGIENLGHRGSESGQREPWRSSGNWGTSGNWATPGHGADTHSGSNWGTGDWGSGQWSGSRSWGNTGASMLGWAAPPSGRFSGRGPRGYQRSDDRIREDINEHLTRHPDIDASEIEVEVHNGEVTLRGAVDDRHAKRMAEDCAEQVSGVRQVHNQIRVEQHQQHGGWSGSGQGSSTREAGSSMSSGPSATQQRSSTEQKQTQSEPAGQRK